MSTEVKKYEISLTINDRTIIIKIQKPGLEYIENYFQNLAGEDNEYTVNYIKEIHSF
jgi:hypothetical protein